LEEKFLALWSRLGGPLLEREYKFHPRRKWQADFVHVPTLLMVEIEGGVWMRGRHNSPRGFIADCEKYNAATLMGWRVLRLTRGHITEEYVGEIKRILFGEEQYR
jgi:very-short-patch-repair endonuclease